MRYIGIDYGAKWVGIAVSDDGGTIAFPRGTFDNDSRLVASIKHMAEEERVEAFVLGDTRAVNGAANPITEAAEQFADELARETGKPVSRALEAWTSIEASRYAPKGRGHDDSAAAAVILQRFLDMHATK